VTKANHRAGGVGYETGILASQLLTSAQIAAKESNTLIPIVRQTHHPRSLPTFVGGRYFVDLSEDTSLDSRTREYEKLVRSLHDTPLHRAPPVGRNPFAPTTTASSASLRLVSASDLELPRALRALRTAAGEALVARQNTFAHLAGSTEALRAAEFLKALNTHHDYLRACVLMAAHTATEAGLFAEELEQVIQPRGWSRAGQQRLVELPYAVGWALHRLLGAALASRSRSSEAVKLALEPIEAVDGNRHPIILRRNLTGWPVRHIDSIEWWRFARTLPNEWPWLTEVFGDSEEYWVAFVAHTLTLNFAEFLWRVRAGPPFDVVRRDREHAPNVPPYYIDEDSDIQRRAVRMMIRDREGLRGALGVLASDPGIRERWAQWISYQQSWRGIESAWGSSSGGAPHADLIDRILDSSRA
jgi:hypothetical protein